MSDKVSVAQILEMKKKGEKIVMLTAYDYATAVLVNQSGVDMILVGDSLANVVLGLESTKEVGLNEMLHHTKAVRRGVKRAMLVGDMPFESYQPRPEEALTNARRFIDEAGCDAVKVEWFDRCPEVVENLVKAGIPVIGHLGLTPQTVDKLGGFKVQGRDLDSAKKIVDQALLLEEKGCFGLVLECIPSEVAAIVSEDLAIPTIGIGAGNSCDGQVLVINDLLGLYERHTPKFVKRYANLSATIRQSVSDYCREVRAGTYPDPGHSYFLAKKEQSGGAVSGGNHRTLSKRLGRALGRHLLFGSRWLIRKMPYPVFQVFIYLFIGLGHCFMLKKRKAACDNLRKVFGREKTEQELEKIASECFNNFGRGMIEVIYYADHPQRLSDTVDFEGKENLDRALKAGRGAICAGAHFGNFLLMYFALVRAGYKVNVITRRTRDQKFEKYISDFRQAFGLKTIYDVPPRRCIHESLQALRNNEVLFIMLDQNYGAAGRVFVDFLGQKAATAAGPVIFSCRTGAPVLPVFIRRRDKNRHTITIEPPLEIKKCAGEQETLEKNVALITGTIEKYIRLYPSMWGGWMHNRWKSRTIEEQTLLDRINEKLQGPRPFKNLFDAGQGRTAA